ncbi:uncharacterized protein LOC117115597 [Anneissia japonica]|uniref:uncharacterized protein LOC117115597 n=1 Tax=Anneissia japonica TaxID=1529436 RepID=UPI001425AD18|nr:uncharacterized protein LOC117115597 [Anneissia japonica]
MDSVKLVCLLNSVLLGFSVHTGSNEYRFPIFIPAVNERLPNIVFLNEGEVVGVANVSVPAVGLDESVVVYAQATFVLYDALHGSNLTNDAISIHIRTSDDIRPYVSLQPSQPSIEIQLVSSAGKEYHFYDTRDYNVDAFCLDILSLQNYTQVKISTDIEQGVVGKSRIINFTEDEIKRICMFTAIDLQHTHVDSTNPVVLMLSGEDTLTGIQHLIDTLIDYSHWGKTFTVYPLLDKQKYRTFVKIFSLKYDNTLYYWGNQIVIKAGNSFEVEVIHPFTLTSENPVFVTMSMYDNSSFHNSPNQIAQSDPILNIPVKPVGQYISRTYIQTPSGSNTSKAIISTLCYGLSHITFDDDPLDVNLDFEITSMTDSDYCLITVPLKPETRHKVHSYLQTAAFTALVYVSTATTNYVYNVGGSGKVLNCKTLIYGHLLYEHDCDVQVYEKNISCSGPPLTCHVEKSECSSCIRLYALIAMGVGSVVVTVALNMFCQMWYCPRRKRKNATKMAKKKLKEDQEIKEKERMKNEALIIIERRLIQLAERNVQKPKDNTTFYNLVAELNVGADKQ